LQVDSLTGGSGLGAELEQLVDQGMWIQADDFAEAQCLYKVDTSLTTLDLGDVRLWSAKFDADIDLPHLSAQARLAQLLAHQRPAVLFQQHAPWSIPLRDIPFEDMVQTRKACYLL